MEAKILIFEDNIDVIQEMVIHLKNLGYKNITTAISKNQALKAIESSYPDIAILDIREPSDSEAGIHIARRLNAIKPIPIIYMTAHPEDRLLTYETSPDAFIQKPDYINVFHAIDIAVRNFSTAKENEIQHPNFINGSIFILKNRVYFHVKEKDILFVEADDGVIIIHALDTTFPISSTIKRFAEQIEDPFFLLVHRSYFVNIRHLESFTKEQVTIKNIKIPMSQNGYDKLIKRIKRLKSK